MLLTVLCVLVTVNDFEAQHVTQSTSVLGVPVLFPLLGPVTPHFVQVTCDTIN